MLIYEAILLKQETIKNISVLSTMFSLKNGDNFYLTEKGISVTRTLLHPKGHFYE